MEGSFGIWRGFASTWPLSPHRVGKSHVARTGNRGSLKGCSFLLTVGRFLLTIELLDLQSTILASLLTIGAFLLIAFAFLLTVGAFLLVGGKCV